MKEKKLTKSPVVIALYVVSALMLVYVCYLIGSTISGITSYYTQYQMTPSFGETVGYVLQAIVQPLMSTIVVFAAARILNQTRALNPANYVEVEKKPVAKPEAKKEETKAATEKKTETKKAEAKKAEPKKTETAKKPAAKKTETAKKPAAKKPAAKKTTTAKKPAAKKTTATK